jgi:hypothetical protein
MTRVLEENYYELAELNFLVKTGIIDWKPPIHNKPEFYGLTEKETINSRIRYLRAEFNAKTQEFDAIKGEYLRGERPYAYIILNSITEKLDKLSRNINFLKARLKGEVVNQPFDLEAIKKVPIDSVVKVNANGFFQTNPFRAEKEPSNSLFYYKAQNRWTDFGSGKSGSIIDLVMAKENCSFVDACKFLRGV